MSNVASPPQAPTLSLASLPPEVLTELRGRCKLSDGDITELLEAVQSGVSTPGEFLGISPAVANTLESMALTFYRHRHYRFAASFYGFLLELDVDRSSAWRGLGACNQALKIYPMAFYCYENALATQPNDLVAKVLLGETTCLMNYTDAGVTILRQALAMGTNVTAHLPYLKRAEAILKAHGVDTEALAAEASERAAQAPGEEPEPVPAVVTQNPLKDLLPEELYEPVDPDKLAALADRFAAGGDDREIFNDPHMHRLVQKLSFGIDLQVITLKDVAGFTDEQMLGGYVAACRYLDIGQPLMCMHIIGWMIYLDSRNPKYYQLAGLSAQHMKLWCLADYLYGISLIYDGETPSPITQIYRGEAKLFSEERHAGLDLLRAGLARSGTDLDEQDAAKRARTLISQFGSKEERSGNRAGAPSVGILDTSVGNKE